MSIGKPAAGPGAGRIYIDQVAQGREDYSAGEGEAAGVWMGTGAAWLGLTGEVGEEALARLLEGREPVRVCCCGRRGRRVRLRPELLAICGPLGTGARTILAPSHARGRWWLNLLGALRPG
jgi:hypothetical protein